MHQLEEDKVEKYNEKDGHYHIITREIINNKVHPFVDFDNEEDKVAVDEEKENLFILNVARSVFFVYVRKDSEYGQKIESDKATLLTSPSNAVPKDKEAPQENTVDSLNAIPYYSPHAHNYLMLHPCHEKIVLRFLGLSEPENLPFYEIPACYYDQTHHSSKLSSLFTKVGDGGMVQSNDQLKLGIFGKNTINSTANDPVIEEEAKILADAKSELIKIFPNASEAIDICMDNSLTLIVYGEK